MGCATFDFNRKEGSVSDALKAFCYKTKAKTAPRKQVPADPADPAGTSQFSEDPSKSVAGVDHSLFSQTAYKGSSSLLTWSS